VLRGYTFKPSPIYNMDKPNLIAINVWFTSAEHRDLVRRKDKMTWHDFIMKLKGGENGTS